MLFLSEQTARLRGENRRITFEQVATVTSTFAAKITYQAPVRAHLERAEARLLLRALEPLLDGPAREDRA